jgi:phage/plasmid-like protein (TIGR03299 family)
MSHLIETINGKSSMAYVGDKPWHGLGQVLTQGQPIEVWQKEAGLDWFALPAVPSYTTISSEQCYIDNARILYRSDDFRPLGIVSDRYQVVQPDQVLEFFDKLSKAAGFELETAGSLSGGKRIWAMARVGDSQKVVNEADQVFPYVLLATSFDGSMATIAKFTSVRVVCQNTLNYSMQDSARVIRISHSTRFNPESVRKELSIAVDSFESFMYDMRKLEDKEISPSMALDLTRELLGVTEDAKRQHSGLSKVMALFQGEAKGSDLTQGLTGWQYVNSVTEWVDHHRGRSQDTRVNSAWFGPGESLKIAAKNLVSQA